MSDLSTTLTNLVNTPSVVGSEGLRSSHLCELPYLEAVVYEGLRFRPTVPFTSVRQVKQPFPVDSAVPAEALLVEAQEQAFADIWGRSVEEMEAAWKSWITKHYPKK